MDFIAALAEKAGLSGTQATAVAGGVLGLVKDQLADSGPPGAAEKLSAAVPELSGWQQAAQAVTGGGGGLGALAGGLGALAGGGGLGALSSGAGGGLLGAVAGAVGGEKAQNTVAIVGVLSSLGLDTSKAAVVGPLALQFLESRLDPATLKMALQAAPMLAAFIGKKGEAAAPTAAAEPEGLGGLGKALGGLFG